MLCWQLVVVKSSFMIYVFYWTTICHIPIEIIFGLEKMDVIGGYLHAHTLMIIDEFLNRK